MSTLVDKNMTFGELLEDILRELDGYADQKWLPGRIEITKERVKALAYKACDHA